MKWDQKSPCASCPYRRDVKVGIWHKSEYENLLRQDENEFGGHMFGCHQFRKKPPEEHRPCAGWLLDQKNRGVPSIQLRMTLMRNKEAIALYNVVSDDGVKLYDSIAQMCRANKVRVPRRR